MCGSTPEGDREKIGNPKLQNRKNEKSEIENRRIADFAKGKRKAGKRCNPFETSAKALENVPLDRIFIPTLQHVIFFVNCRYLES
jgi:hypothetical protein